MIRPTDKPMDWQHSARKGNVWSGVVALVLLGMFTLALISSELAATDASSEGSRLPTVIAGQ
ncbi:MAG: hypothetical protein AAFO81_03910 [Pseudomonadota bacterium]